VYRELVAELVAANGSTSLTSLQAYIPDTPEPSHPVGQVKQLCVLGQVISPEINRERQYTLNKIGWHLPIDIQGSTESDCAYPAAIATINIRNLGMQGHLQQVEQVIGSFAPTEEMVSRSHQWLSSGRSAKEGNRMLSDMDIDLHSLPQANVDTPIARILASKLFPIR
jgi:hypothetical protein